MNIIEFDHSDTHYDAYAKVVNTIWSDIPITVEQAKHWDTTRDEKYLYQRLLGVVDDQVVAYAEYMEPSWSPRPHKYHLEVAVTPAFERQGIGSALYDHVINQLEQYEPHLLTSATREDKVQATQFLEKRGYQLVMRYPRSGLDVQAFDSAAFEAWVKRFDDAQYTVRTASTLMDEDPDALHKLYTLECEIMKDVPLPDTYVPKPFEQWEPRTLEDPAFMPDAWFIALDGETYAGMSCLWKDLSREDRLYTGLTGTLREYRRKGIATALKVRAIDYARTYGAATIETDNEENNPMFQLNLALGFKPLPAWVDYHLQLNSE